MARRIHRRPRRFPAACLALLAGCAHAPQTESASRLFDQVEIGMTRAQVEALLGAPVMPPPSLQDEVWYLPPPALGPVESPYAPGAIGIRFAPDGKVASKRLNPQADRE